MSMGDGNTRSCPDDGRCWHECVTSCWRVRNAGPFTDHYPGDTWPADIVAANQVTRDPGEDFLLGLAGRAEYSSGHGKSNLARITLGQQIENAVAAAVEGGLDVDITDVKAIRERQDREAAEDALEDDDTGPCDAEEWGATPSYADGHCRCLVCSRCGHHTGNSTFGHWGTHCRVLAYRTDRSGFESVGAWIEATGRPQPHLCCPDPAFGCEIEPGEPMTLPRRRTDGWRWYCRLCGAGGTLDSQEARDTAAHDHLRDTECGRGRMHREEGEGRMLHVWGVSGPAR
jgi:hypothetical protein